ncbi:unnamed protein product [Angiostrongylus costaricensis]|uniref:Fanconi-associated nuclease n=1 Tax=Angiostrongylus costaricensis TaxID=334426 RepID=A0A0R3PNP8_ANGCS|nr:unnamed protein product [Angiostrongylus costaricensis]
MSSDIRIVPFTDEEKARLNEKGFLQVQKMRFSRPPPKLPAPRLVLKTAPSQATSLQASVQLGQSLNEKGNVIDDSGISSCGSEKDSSPGFRCSPVDLIAQYVNMINIFCFPVVCFLDGSPNQPDKNNHTNLSYATVVDGEEKEEDRLVDSVENNEDFNHLESYHILTAACNNVAVNSPSNHPVEVINARSPIVYSQQLQSTLNRNRGDLLGIALRAEEKIGKFENPTYGRLLLTKNFPVESMKYIMNSAIKNLTAYFNNRKPEPVRVVLKSKSDASPSLSDTSVRNENDSRKEDKERVEPEVNDIKLVCKKKRKRNNKRNESIVNANSMNSSAQSDFEQQHEIRNMRKKRKRNLSIVSTTSDGPKKSFKIVIRRDAPTEVANPLLARIIPASSATNESEDGSVHNGQCSSSFILEDRIGDHTPQHSETNTITRTSTLVTGNRVFKEESVDEDVVIVHENIRVTPEERSLVAQLAALINVDSVNTEQFNWFDELLRKAGQFARHIDHHVEMLMSTKLELARIRLNQMAERNRCRSLLQKQRSAMSCRDVSFNVSDAIAPELLSQCSQISPDMSYLSLKDVNSPQDVTAAVPFQIPVSLTTERRPQNVHWIAKRTSELSKPRYMLKKGLCCERKYGIAATGKHVESLIHRPDPIAMKDLGEIKEVS